MSIIYEALQKVEKRPSFSRPRISPSPRPKKHNNKSLIVILTVSITTIGLLYSFQGKRFTNTSRPSKNSSTLTSTSVLRDELQDKPATKPRRFTLPKLSFTWTNSKRKTDSFNTKVYEGVEFTLSGIIYTKKKPMAIINGRRITIGDTVKEAKVTDIKEDSVELIFNNKKIILALY